MKNRAIYLMVVILLFSLKISFAEDDILIVQDQTATKSTINMPYAFFNDSFGAAVAYVYSVVGSPQPQSAFLTSAMAGTKGSAMAFMMGRDLQIYNVPRLFLDPIMSGGYFVENNAYINGNPEYAGSRAGSNDSDMNNYVTGDGLDVFFRIKFKYLLPIGHGREQIIPSYKINDGLLESGATGGESMNPMVSGRTFVELRPFYRSQQIKSDDINSTVKTNGVDLSLFWDNRDFPINPSYGNSHRVRVSRDFGAFDSSSSWSVLEAEADQYFSIGPSDWFGQRVIALDLWTAYSPTWEVHADGSISNNPPSYTGATLGGLFRMRGYPTQRFSDKAAIYCGSEFRMTLHRNPLINWPNLQKHLGIKWIQFVPFFEFGRVAPHWTFDEFHHDIKWDAGASLRAMAKGLVVRIDVARSEESTNVQMMVGHPFQF
jgi:outer membrane protein assembly factor BamA